LVPGAGTVIGLVLVGALAGVAAGPRLARWPPPRAVRVGAPVALGMLAAAGLALGATGYVERHVAGGLPDGGLLTAALARPEFAGGRFPIAMAPALNALLAGDRLAHPVKLIPGGTSCNEVRRRRRAGWVVLQRLPPTPQYRRLAACLRGDRPVFAGPAYELHAG